MSETPVISPAPVMGLFDLEMWHSVANRNWQLQCCADCGTFQYPPAPGCANCLSQNLRWQAVSGLGKIISWTIFEKQYLPAYPAPYNVIAVKLAEGPVVISNLEGEMPTGSWIGRAVNLIYATMPDGTVLPRFTLNATSA